MLSSLDGLLAQLGGLSLAVKVEDKSFGREKSSNLQQQVSKQYYQFSVIFSFLYFSLSLSLSLPLPLSMFTTC